MAAGQGTDVRDAAFFLFTQTVAELAHTGTYKQVCRACSLLRLGLQGVITNMKKFLVQDHLNDVVNFLQAMLALC